MCLYINDKQITKVMPKPFGLCMCDCIASLHQQALFNKVTQVLQANLELLSDFWGWTLLLRHTKISEGHILVSSLKPPNSNLQIWAFNGGQIFLVWTLFIGWCEGCLRSSHVWSLPCHVCLIQVNYVRNRKTLFHIPFWNHSNATIWYLWSQHALLYEIFLFLAYITWIKQIWWGKLPLWNNVGNNAANNVY